MEKTVILKGKLQETEQTIFEFIGTPKNS